MKHVAKIEQILLIELTVAQLLWLEIRIFRVIVGWQVVAQVKRLEETLINLNILNGIAGLLQEDDVGVDERLIHHEQLASGQLSIRFQLLRILLSNSRHKCS